MYSALPIESVCNELLNRNVSNIRTWKQLLAFVGQFVSWCNGKSQYKQCVWYRHTERLYCTVCWNIETQADTSYQSSAPLILEMTCSACFALKQHSCNVLLESTPTSKEEETVASEKVPWPLWCLSFIHSISCVCCDCRDEIQHKYYYYAYRGTAVRLTRPSTCFPVHWLCSSLLYWCLTWAGSCQKTTWICCGDDRLLYSLHTDYCSWWWVLMCRYGIVGLADQFVHCLIDR